MKDEDLWHFRHGPSPGDLAEVEAFCRIFRLAEQVHNVVMDALCSVKDARQNLRSMPDASNGSVSDLENITEDQEIPLLEEKVVSGLGCIGALVYQQKQEVLNGRLNVGFTPVARHDTMPPLAKFRARMKKFCEELESILLCYFPADDIQFKAMHKTFQKLQNVCLDAGYSRKEGAPSHADIPNWGVVKSRTPWSDELSAVDNEIAFWRGGQPTDDGIQWLIDKGFKVIVDMRREDSADFLAKSAMDAAVCLGKLKHIKLPVEAGSNPTKDQVVDFAKHLADPNSRPLYLHSQKGVGRTSAMVSRWREIGLLTIPSKEHNLPDLSSNDDFNLRDKKPAENVSEDADHNSHETTDFTNGAVKSTDRYLSDPQDQTSKSMKEKNTDFIRPFDAQRPVSNYLSRHEMSKFMRGRRIFPQTFNQIRTPQVSKTVNTKVDESDTFFSSTEEPAGRWIFDRQGIPRAMKMDERMDRSVPSRYGNGSISTEEAKELGDPADNSSQSVSSEKMTRDSGFYNVVGNDDDEEDNTPIVGDMCASTTGVVRLQSRKKAEMYLVRTDGFSCTREKVKESTLAFTHPSTQQQMLMWKTAPKTVLLLKKLGSELMQEAQQVASFLHYKEGMNVIVEPEVHDRFARVPGFGFIQTFHVQDTSNLHERIDFVVCLGGDGVILHASNIFRNAVPPVVSFNLGSLGFLTAHPFEDFMQDLRAIIHGNTMVEGVYITLRMRLRCELFRGGNPVPGKVFDVLNEVVVDRGSNPYLCKIECYERNRLITKVQADGVIVATPTGSTAYSTAAGGSMVHPNVPCMLFTPICPHSLSFRPVILPDSALLELKVPEDARSNAWVSFDGKRRQQLSRGDSIRICMSQHPLPTVNKSDQTDDWFQSLVRCLNWNERLEQKALP
ncbi:hypothetical protein KP509_04G034000 [Ceratopteris richardii]|nr:hypothetical protein KP509_04G034000 [Ceratopteris richardii]